MLRSAACVLTALSLPAARHDAGPFAPPDAERPPGSTVTVVRTEHYVFEDADGTSAGYAVWRRLEGRRGLQLERDLWFAPEPGGSEDSGVHHVECLERAGSRLVVRESDSGGRAIVAELTPAEGDLRASEWGPCGARRELIPLTATTAFPLYVAELARDGRFAAGSIGCFDPLAGAVVTVEARTTYAVDGVPGRTTELRREDGTLLLELRFTGRTLTGFRLQDGGPWARNIDAETWTRLRGSTEAAPDAEPRDAR